MFGMRIVQGVALFVLVGGFTLFLIDKTADHKLGTASVKLDPVPPKEGASAVHEVSRSDSSSAVSEKANRAASEAIQLSRKQKSLQDLFDTALASRVDEDRSLPTYFAIRCLSLSGEHFQIKEDDVQYFLEGSGVSYNSATVAARVNQSRLAFLEYCRTGDSGSFLDRRRALSRSGIGRTGAVFNEIFSKPTGSSEQEFYQAISTVISNPPMYVAQFDWWLTQNLLPAVSKEFRLGPVQSHLVINQVFESFVTDNDYVAKRRMINCVIDKICEGAITVSSRDQVEITRVAAVIESRIREQRIDLLYRSR